MSQRPAWGIKECVSANVWVERDNESIGGRAGLGVGGQFNVPTKCRSHLCYDGNFSFSAFLLQKLRLRSVLRLQLNFTLSSVGPRLYETKYMRH